MGVPQAMRAWRVRDEYMESRKAAGASAPRRGRGRFSQETTRDRFNPKIFWRGGLLLFLFPPHFPISVPISAEDVEKDKIVLKKYDFPKGHVIYSQNGESYKDIAEEIIQDVLIEDDCESIGGEKEMTITFVRLEIKQKIKSIVVKEFSGIDHLSDDLSNFLNTGN